MTITNRGTIEGSHDAILFRAATDHLIVGAGSNIFGEVVGGGGLLELSAPTGTITALGASGAISGPEAMSFTGFGAYMIAAGADWTLTAGNALAAGQTFTNLGDLTVAGALKNSGTLYNRSGETIVDGAVSGAGKVEIDAGVADFVSTFIQNVTFVSGATGTLELAKSRTYTGEITGFSKTGANALDLADITFVVGKTEATFAGTATSGVLTVTDGSRTAKITLEGDYLGETFAAVTDGHGGTKVTAGTSTAAAFANALAAFAPAASINSPVSAVERATPSPTLLASR